MIALGKGAAPIVVVALTLIAGCGYQLRGWDLESSVESVHVAASPGVRLAVPLRRALRQAGVPVQPRPVGAQMTVALLEESRQRRTVAVTGSARAAEYEISIGLRFALRGADAVLREPQWLEVSRVFSVDRDNIAGTAGEQALIEAELADDLVQQIIRAMNAAALQMTPPASADAG